MDMERLLLQHGQRLSTVEQKVESIDKHLIKQELSLEKIAHDSNRIALTIASGKGWLVGVLGLMAIVSTIGDWVIQIMK